MTLRSFDYPRRTGIPGFPWSDLVPGDLATLVSRSSEWWNAGQGGKRFEGIAAPAGAPPQSAVVCCMPRLLNKACSLTIIIHCYSNIG